MSKKQSNGGWFRKGRSGTGGRPIGSRAPQSSVFDIIVEKTLTVTRHGITRETTMEEALQQRIYQDALAGKGMALRAIAKALIRSEESVKQRAKEDGLKIAKLR